MFISPDLSAIYDACGDAVTLEGESTPRMGIFAEAGQDVFDGSMVGSAPTIRFPVALWPAIKRDQRLTASGRTWRVRAAPKPLLDGLEAVVELEIVQP